MSSLQSTYNQSRQQLLLIAIIMFGSIVAAVVTSTAITMSIMKGEVANAVAQSSQAQPTLLNGCTDVTATAQPDDEESDSKSVSDDQTTSNTTVSNVSYTTVDNSRQYVDNSKGKTVVKIHDESVNTNVITQTGLVNNVDLSEEVDVSPINVIDNTVKINSDNITQNTIVAPVLSPFTDVEVVNEATSASV